MTGVCLGLAAVIQLALPTNQFTLAWKHSVEKIRWEEEYHVDGDRLVAVAARVRGSGAGMEIPDGAVLRDGAWEYRPALPPMERLRLTRSGFTSDYQLCWEGKCYELTGLLGPAEEGSVIEISACPPEQAANSFKPTSP